MKFSIARYRFVFKVVDFLFLPDYAGSTLRGVFGRSLRQLACVTKALECRGCSLIAHCPYSVIFSPHDIPRQDNHLETIQQIPVPYIIEAPLKDKKNYHKDEEFSFEMVLMGRAISEVSMIILAWRRAFLRGVGKDHGTAELLRVEHIEGQYQSIKTIYSNTAPLVTSHSIEIDVPDFLESQNVHLQFLTPVRLQHQGKIVSPKELTGALFLRQLIRRISFQQALMQGNHLSIEVIHQLNEYADAVFDERRLKWHDWSRYSSRQQQAMTLGGIIGRLYLKEVPARLLPFLYIGQWLHLGKETVFGLGHYRWCHEPWLVSRAENVENKEFDNAV